MASRSLGTLTLDLVAKIGGYVGGLNAADRASSKFAADQERRFKQMSLAAEAAGEAMGRFIADGVYAAARAFQESLKIVADFQDLADKTGASAEGLASFAVAAGTAGTSMDEIASASVKLTKNLTGVDDESKAAGAALEALGINISDFQKLSPEDQMEEVAKSLGNVANAADQTAIAMDLFGKSGASVLPFLKALQEQGGRTVILTAEMIRQADAYADAQAKAMTELKLYVGVLSAQALPAISDLTKALTDTAKEMLGVDNATNTLRNSTGVQTFAENAVDSLAFIVDAANGVRVVFSRLGEFIGATSAALLEKIRGNEAGVEAIRKAYNESLDTSQFKSLRDTVNKSREERKALERLAAQEVRGFVPAGPARSYQGRQTSSGSRRGGGGRAAQDPFAEAQRYLESLQKQLEKTQDLTVAEQALLDIQAGRLGKVSEAQQTAILDTARQIDAAKALEAQEKATAKAIEEQLKLRKQLEEEGARFTEQFLTPQEKFAKSIENVNRLLDEGVISVETAARAVQSYRKELEESNKAVDEFDEFTKNAIRGTQDSIAGFLEDLATGGKKSFKEIAADFGTMLAKMAAQAVAADITKKLFGQAGGGQGEGWLGSLIGAAAGARASGGPVLPNTMYQVNERGPEVFESANGSQYLMTGSMGGRVNANSGTTIVQNFAPGTDRRTVQQAALSASRELQRAQRNA